MQIYCDLFIVQILNNIPLWQHGIFLLCEPALPLITGEPGPQAFGLLSWSKPGQEGRRGMHLLEPIDCISLLQPLKASISGCRRKIQPMAIGSEKRPPLLSSFCCTAGSLLSPFPRTAAVCVRMESKERGREICYLPAPSFSKWTVWVIGTDYSLCLLITEA